jgi:hypothetical protein
MHYVGNLLVPRAFSVEFPALRCSADTCANLAGPPAFAGILLLAASVTAALATARRARRPEGAVWVWPAFTASWIAIWLGALAFVVGAHEPGADRHAYVLLAAAAVAMAAFASRSSRASRATQTAACAALLVWSALLASRAGERIAVWRDDLTLWRAAVATSPSSPRVHYNLAAALADEGRFGSARRHLARASAIDPTYWPSPLGFAGIDCARGRFAAAEVRIAEARALGASPDDVARVLEHCASVKRGG